METAHDEDEDTRQEVDLGAESGGRGTHGDRGDVTLRLRRVRQGSDSDNSIPPTAVPAASSKARCCCGCDQTQALTTLLVFAVIGIWLTFIVLMIVVGEMRDTKNSTTGFVTEAQTFLHSANTTALWNRLTTQVPQDMTDFSEVLHQLLLILKRFNP